MRVGSFKEIADVLRKQGVEVQNFHELQPRYLKAGGYVGFPVAIEGKEWVCWVSTLGAVRPQAKDRANTAEWLTWHLIHAGGERSVQEVMDTFLRARIEFARPQFANWPGQMKEDMESMDRLSLLAYMAAFMGFVTDEEGRDLTMKLPEDHPLAHLAYTVPKAEKAVA